MTKEVSAVTSGAKPSNSDFLNLDNYVENSGGVPFDSTPLASKIHYVPLPGVTSVSESDGFQAEAFASTDAAGNITGNSKVIIVYKQDDPTASLPPTLGKILSDTGTLFGLHSLASGQFADKVLVQASNDQIRASNVFVTGQSFGGADAEYAAKTEGLGGATFGAPGIKATGSNTSLTDYVDAVDPIGNFSVDQPWGQALSLGLSRAITLELGHEIGKLPLPFLKDIPSFITDAVGNVFTDVLDKLLSVNHYGTTVTVNSTSKLLPAFNQLTKDLQKAASSSTTTLDSLETSLGLPLIYFLTKPPYEYNGFSGKGDFNSIEQYAKDLKVTLFPVCFASGTLIRTARGDVEVEALRVGDRVVNSAGDLREVRWLGHRTLDCSRHPHPASAMPIRIAAHAFGANRPSRDLVVSPGHAVCVDVMGEVLVPAVALVNGTSVRQIPCDEVTYWHVELDSHDVILAENLPTESYLEMGNRRFFREAGVVALDGAPDARVQTHADFCRPYHDHGPVVDAARAMLNAKATPDVGESETGVVARRRVA